MNREPPYEIKEEKDIPLSEKVNYEPIPNKDLESIKQMSVDQRREWLSKQLQNKKKKKARELGKRSKLARRKNRK